jgi:hypothetical protein
MNRIISAQPQQLNRWSNISRVACPAKAACRAEALRKRMI